MNPEFPKDPVMLLSFINMKLRNDYKDLKTLCNSYQVDETVLVKSLAGIDYHYDIATNQFK